MTDNINLTQIQKELDENNKNEASIESNVDKLELYSDKHPFRLSLRIKNFENESDCNKFIKSVERMIRNSYEYKLWREYIIDILGVNKCAITNEKMDEVKIEVHHHIPSLYSLVKAIVNRKIEKNQEFSTFDIAIECIELHFKNKVGYITLLKSIHEKFHNGFLAIPIQLVKGNYLSFLKEFSKYLDQDDLDTINTRMSIKSGSSSWSSDNYPGVKAVGEI